MGIELRDIKDFKVIIYSLIKTSGMPFDHALDILISECETYQIEDFIEVLVDKLRNKGE
jgi:hypothetical protein